MTVIESPPPFCDLAWRPGGEAVFTAARTPLYDAAVSCARSGMVAAGFDVDAACARLYLTACPDAAILAKRLSGWTKAAHRELDFIQKRDAAARPLTGERIAPVQAGLVLMLAENAWALGNRINLAEGFAHAEALSKRQYEWACDILAGARGAVASADARLATEAGAAALERAYDEAVRIDLLAACCELTALDTDRCREANGMGWGATTSAPGHRFAGMVNLTVLQAAHALGLVHPHRRQLTPALRERLFGQAS